MQLINNQSMTMSSIEIADLTGKRHDNVISDINKMLSSLGLNAPDFSGTQMYGNNNMRDVFYLPKRETLILISGYYFELRAKIIDRWQELEAQQKPALPKSYAEALLEAGRLALENEKQAEQLRLAAPKIEFVDKYVERSSLQTATQVAATFGMSAVKMNKLLDEIGSIYDKRIKRSRAFCADWIAKGYGETKQNEQGYSSSLFTPAGIMRLTEIFTSEGVI